MKKVVFTFLIVSILGVSSIASQQSKVGGASNIEKQITYQEVSGMDYLCANMLESSFTNSVVSIKSVTVPAELPIFTSFLNRNKKFRIFPISRTCTGFVAVLKI